MVGEMESRRGIEVLFLLPACLLGGCVPFVLFASGVFAPTGYEIRIENGTTHEFLATVLTSADADVAEDVLFREGNGFEVISPVGETLSFDPHMSDEALSGLVPFCRVARAIMLRVSAGPELDAVSPVLREGEHLRCGSTVTFALIETEDGEIELVTEVLFCEPECEPRRIE